MKKNKKNNNDWLADELEKEDYTSCSTHQGTHVVNKNDEQDVIMKLSTTQNKPIITVTTSKTDIQKTENVLESFLKSVIKGVIKGLLKGLITILLIIVASVVCIEIVMPGLTKSIVSGSFSEYFYETFVMM